MKNTYCIAALAALSFGATAANADVDISVAIQGEIVPGVYGRVNSGGRPPPTLVYARPVMIEQPPAQVVVEEPIYLHVPPEHARDWRRHCGEYHACNRRVYFVRSAEYDPGYVRANEDEHDRREEWAREEHDMRREEHDMRREERERRKEHERREERGEDGDRGHDHEEHDRDRERAHDHD